MNRILNVYADLEAFYDYRRGLLQLLMTPDISDPDKRKYEADKLWEMHIADNYRNRRMDTFNYPMFKIDKEKFQEVFDKRGVTEWASGMFYPTPLIKQMLGKIIDLEGLTDQPIDIKEVKLFVNTYPYDFPADLIELLEQQIYRGMRGFVKVKAFRSDPSTHTAQFYGQYQYVFRYNFMLDETSTVFMESIKAHPIPETTVVIADILARETQAFDGPVKNWMFGAFTTLAPAVRFVPIERSLYDYA